MREIKCSIITGSLRNNGNTEIMSYYFMKKIREGNICTEIINLSNNNVQPCKDCGFCKENGYCILNDDMDGIIEKIKDTNILVFATPVYWGGMTGSMKCFIDRLGFYYEKITDVKYGCLLVNSEYESNLNLIGDHFSIIFKYLGLEYLGMLSVSGMKNKGDMENDTYVKKILDFANEIIDNVFNNY